MSSEFHSSATHLLVFVAATFSRAALPTKSWLKLTIQSQTISYGGTSWSAGSDDQFPPNDNLNRFVSTVPLFASQATHEAISGSDPSAPDDAGRKSMLGVGKLPSACVAMSADPYQKSDVATYMIYQLHTHAQLTKSELLARLEERFP